MESATVVRFIEAIVRAQDAQFQKREDEKTLARALAHVYIERGLIKGRVEPGGRDRFGRLTVKAATEAAILEFRGDLNCVFIEGNQQTDLDAPAALLADTPISFPSSIALHGG